MKKAKVAIITRTKNRPILLERAINSVLTQSYKDWVHTIVNDGGIPEAVDNLVSKYKGKYAERDNAIYNEVSKDKWAAANTGINSCKSDYIVLHDDDDSWETEFLNKTVAYLEQNPEIGGVLTHQNYIIEEIKEKKINIIDKYPINTDIKHINLFKCVIDKVYPSPISFVFRRSIYEKLGGFDESFAKSGDIEFSIRFMAEHEIDVIPECLSNYHSRPYNQDQYQNVTLGSNNTSVLEANGHKDLAYWENKIKTKLLKDDLKQNKLGVGFIYNFLTSFGPMINAQQNLNSLEKHQGKKIVFYGAGIKAAEFIEKYKDELKKHNVLGILDQSPEKQGKELSGYKIFSPDTIEALKPDIVILTVANTSMVLPYTQKLIQEKELNCEIISDL